LGRARRDGIWVVKIDAASRWAAGMSGAGSAAVLGLPALEWWRHGGERAAATAGRRGWALDLQRPRILDGGDEIGRGKEIDGLCV
jgi:hypothetical protein